jgi:hypothetical protein
MPTYADVCRRILTYADVFSRMLFLSTAIRLDRRRIVLEAEAEKLRLERLHQYELLKREVFISLSVSSISLSLSLSPSLSLYICIYTYIRRRGRKASGRAPASIRASQEGGLYVCVCV